MENHFSTIGFDVQTEDDLRPLIEKAYTNGKSFPTEHGKYVRWEIGEGVELWLGIDRDGVVVTFHPHFSGEAQMSVEIVGKIAEGPNEPLVGSLRVWADPKAEVGEKGCYPFLFAVPNFDSFENTQFPLVGNAQLTAFAHEIFVYQDDEDFATRSGDSGMASESFIPTGMFFNNEDGKGREEPKAAFAGHVLQESQKTNPLSGRPFWALRVQTYGGILDVVAAPELIDTRPRVEGVVQGSFWLSGRLVG